ERDGVIVIGNGMRIITLRVERESAPIECLSVVRIAFERFVEIRNRTRVLAPVEPSRAAQGKQSGISGCERDGLVEIRNCAAGIAFPQPCRTACAEPVCILWREPDGLAEIGDGAVVPGFAKEREAAIVESRSKDRV